MWRHDFDLLLQLHHLDLELNFLIVDLLLNLFDPTLDQLHVVLDGLNLLLSIVRRCWIRWPADGVQGARDFFIRFLFFLNSFTIFVAFVRACRPPSHRTARRGSPTGTISAKRSHRSGSRGDPDRGHCKARPCPHERVRSWRMQPSNDILCCCERSGSGRSNRRRVGYCTALRLVRCCRLYGSGRSPVWHPRAELGEMRFRTRSCDMQSPSGTGPAMTPSHHGGPIT